MIIADSSGNIHGHVSCDHCFPTFPDQHSLQCEQIADLYYPGKPFPVKGYITRNGEQQIFCPFCGCRHHHGSDREQIEGQRGPVIGCRVPHCGFHPVAKRGYDIVETSPEPMPKILTTLARENERRRDNAYRKGTVYQPRWLAGWVAGWAPGTAPGPDWEPHPYEWLPDIDPKWKRGHIE